MHLVPLAARINGCRTARQEHDYGDLHQLSHRVSRTLPVGTSAGRAGLHQLPRCARLSAAGSFEIAPAVSMSNLS